MNILSKLQLATPNRKKLRASRRKNRLTTSTGFPCQSLFSSFILFGRSFKWSIFNHRRKLKISHSVGIMFCVAVCENQLCPLNSKKMAILFLLVWNFRDKHTYISEPSLLRCRRERSVGILNDYWHQKTDFALEHNLGPLWEQFLWRMLTFQFALQVTEAPFKLIW